MKRPLWIVLHAAAAAMAGLLACAQPTNSENGGGLSLQLDASAAAWDSVKVLVRGPTNKTVKVTPGSTVTVDGLIAGRYTIAIEAFSSGGVVSLFQTTDVNIVANQNASVTPTMADFVSFVPTMGTLPSSGTSTTFTVSYSSVIGAVSYEAEAATDVGFTTNRAAATSTTTSAQITVPTFGTYFVRVRAIDAYQGRGQPSPSQTIQLAALPTILLSTTTASFSAAQGGANPTPQTVTVTNGGGGTLSGLSAPVTYTPGQPTGWLTASLNTTTAPSTLTVTATTGSRVTGTYTATVAVTSSVATNTPQIVNVTFTVAGPGPSILLSSTSKTFTATQGGGNPATQSATITNGGNGTLNGLSAAVTYTPGQPTGWLAASLNTTTAPSTLTLTATTGGLTGGTYTASVEVTSAVASNSPQTVSVTFTVVGPAIVLSGTSRNFSGTQAGGNPAAQTVTITNGGGGTLSGLSAPVTYTLDQPTGWLTASLSTTTAPSTLTLTATTGSLLAGTYTASVAVSSALASNSPQAVSVTFTVVAPPAAIVLSSTSRSFSATEGGGNPAAQTVNITNGGTGTLSGLSAPVSYTPGQPTGWLTANLSTGTAPSTLTLTATTGSLAAGTYTATVAVTSSAANNSPQTVSTTFTVAAPVPTIALSSTSRSFSATQGGSSPAAQTVTITNGGTGTLSGLSAPVTYTAGQPTGWLIANLSTTTAPSTLTLTATTGALAAGIYTANVAVTSAAASNSPQTVSVTFTVALAPAIGLSSTSQSFNGTQGGPSPAGQVVTITNGGGGTLSGLSAPVTYTAGQPTGWLTASLSTTTAPSNLTLTVTTGSLVAGTYTASVAVTSAVATNSPQTVSVTFTVVLPTPPAAPTSLIATNGNNRVTLTWVDNSTNENGFQIERCSGTTCSTFAPLTTVGPNINTYANTNLSNGTYRYRVYAYNAAANSGYSNIVNGTPN